ncbi:MAG: AAA family ATPase [Nitrospirota bacterium]
MYESFYRLRTKPFALLPDGESLYPGSTHRTAYSLLEYGLMKEAPFMVLTGEPGMGKTSLLRKLIAEHHEKYSIGFVTNARYEVEHLLPWILLAFGLCHKRVDPVEAYHTFSEFLHRESKRHRRVVLIVDEAQSLGAKLLEELRLLSNLNDGKAFKLQIILSGQPDLHTLLQRIDMTQFAQRIVVDHHLEPFTEEETSKYISHRLQKAGGNQSLFTTQACSLVHRLSKGIPRLINQICDVSLTYGFAEQTGFIPRKLVAQAALDRSRGGILPLGAIEELSMLADCADDPHEIPVPVLLPQLNVPSFQADIPSPEPRVNQSAFSPGFLYSQGMDLKKERCFKEAIEAFDRASQAPLYRLKASAQAGLCYAEIGEHHAAVKAFRTALRDESAPLNEVINLQYLLARTLESVGEGEEASTLYQRIVRINPNFKDAASRMKRRVVPQKPIKNGKRTADTTGSWFSQALDSLHQLIGSRR